MGDVTLSEVFRQQGLDRGRDESCWLLPEKSAGLTIGVAYDAPPIYHEDCIG
jgi:hypothetical protein